VPSLGEVLFEGAAEFEAGVVGGDVNPHYFSLGSRRNPFCHLWPLPPGRSRLEEDEKLSWRHP
jgi:hypothetical protein